MNVRNARPPEQIALLSVLHFLNDIHISFLPTFVPELVRRLGLSLETAYSYLTGNFPELWTAGHRGDGDRTDERQGAHVSPSSLGSTL